MITCEWLFTIQKRDNGLIFIFLLTFILIFNTCSSNLRGVLSNFCEYLVRVLFSLTLALQLSLGSSDSFLTMKPFCREWFPVRWWCVAFYLDRNQNLSVIDIEQKQVYPLHRKRGRLTANYFQRFETGKETLPNTSCKRNKPILFFQKKIIIAYLSQCHMQ